MHACPPISGNHSDIAKCIKMLSSLLGVFLKAQARKYSLPVAQLLKMGKAPDFEGTDKGTDLITFCVHRPKNLRNKEKHSSRTKNSFIK
jgi:hypothetical protein